MTLPLGLETTKVIGIHLNYRSRADERGRTPSHPSYFLKPPSSLSADGDPVVRPGGCELLAYEGEVAVVIGERARNVTPEQAASHVGFYAASNDFGVYDMRWADRGSNLMAKGQDGFTPIGPRLAPASELDGGNLVLRTYVNGEVVQEDSTANLIFTFAELIADLSRFVTLEPGDVILTGTPRNSRPVQPGDVVEVEVEGVGRIRNEVVEGDELAPYGAMPKVTPEVRAAALGSNTPRPAVISDETKAALKKVATATLTVQLRKRGINDTFMRGLRPSRPDMRMVGYAHTLRYVALREDVRDADTAKLNQQRQAIEAIGEDEVLVMEARGDDRAGTIGDIMATRLLRRGGAGIVTDGGVRDSQAIAELDIPMYFKAPHAGVFGLIHYPLERNVPVTCAGVLVMPGDVIVGDPEGALVIPAAMAEEVARDALEQEEREEFALERVDAGESIPAVYPLPEERRAEFEEWRAGRRR
jgi:2-keto-4-pentenoate hydratase/2-oxohepta-3-ene-1,7-dioic acid hydratase in catechol pathway/regulator of RNase E activity RraA